VLADLEEKGIAATEAELRTEIERAAADARRQIAQSSSLGELPTISRRRVEGERRWIG
jgi:hypothetical protein